MNTEKIPFVGITDEDAYNITEEVQGKEITTEDFEENGEETDGTSDSYFSTEEYFD